MPHVLLLGDSIFDNAAYVSGGTDVVTQLREMLPTGWEATLCALDGAVVSDLRRQLPQVPRDATDLVLSAGGNDALEFIDILHRPSSSFAEVLDTLASIGERFEEEYREAIAEVLRLGLPLTLCTIYNGWLPDPDLRRRAQTALTIFDDVILRIASAHDLRFIELRHVCTEAADYANPIEPSVQGGRKIACAIREALFSTSGRT